MTGRDMIAELVQCYVPPPGKVQEKMIQLADTIPESARKEVIDRILEEEGSSTKISITHIVEACRAIGVGYKAARYVPATDWICDSCGNKFKYHAAPTDDDKIDKGIHDLCPHCGFQVIWTIEARGYKTKDGFPEWYQRLIEKHSGENRNISKKANSGLEFWARHSAERERAKELEENAKDKIAEIDRAKRWDIDDRS